MMLISAFIYSLLHQPLIKCFKCSASGLSYDIHGSSYKSIAIFWPGDLNTSEEISKNFVSQINISVFELQSPVDRHSSCAKMHRRTWNSAFFARLSSQTLFESSILEKNTRIWKKKFFLQLWPCALLIHMEVHRPKPPYFAFDCENRESYRWSLMSFQSQWHSMNTAYRIPRTISRRNEFNSLIQQNRKSLKFSLTPSVLPHWICFPESQQTSQPVSWSLPLQ